MSANTPTYKNTKPASRPAAGFSGTGFRGGYNSGVKRGINANLNRPLRRLRNPRQWALDAMAQALFPASSPQRYNEPTLIDPGSPPSSWVDKGTYYEVPGHVEAIVASTPYKQGLTYPQNGYLSGPSSVASIAKSHATGRWQHWYGEYDPDAFPYPTLGRWFYSASYAPQPVFVPTYVGAQAVGYRRVPQRDLSTRPLESFQLTAAGARRRPPKGRPTDGKPETKVKLVSGLAQLLKRLTNALGEGVEWIDIFAELAGYDRNKRKPWLKGRTVIYDKIVYLFVEGNIDNVDWEAYLEARNYNSLEDFTYGAIGEGSKGASSSLGQSFGFQTGLAL